MEIDLTKPNPARVVDYYLGGHHNFDIDRFLGDRMAELYPGDLIEEAKAMRRSLQRVVRYMVEEKGLTQFLDFGAGLPTCGNTHEVVQALDPQSKVIYSDVDHFTVAYGKEIIADEPNVRYLWCDAADPSTLLDSPETKELLGNDRRVGIIFMTLAHYIDDETLASGARKLYEWAAPGSHLFLAVESEMWKTDPYLQEVSKLVHRAGIPLYQRTKAELLALLSPWRLTEHGIARNFEWGLPEEERNPEGKLAAYSMVLYK